MTDPGRLRHRLTLEAPVESADDTGGVVRSYAAAATMWAAIEPLIPRETVDADGLAATLTHRITIRAGVTVTTRHRLVLGARVLRILTVRDPDESGRFLEIGAEERRS
jgi:SPP1 family predicted phage head-tail adaptor